MSIPPEFLGVSPVADFKYEVLATEESGNQIIFEGEFSLEDDDDDDDDDGDDDGRDRQRPRRGGHWGR